MKKLILITVILLVGIVGFSQSMEDETMPFMGSKIVLDTASNGVDIDTLITYFYFREVTFNAITVDVSAQMYVRTGAYPDYDTTTLRDVGRFPVSDFPLFHAYFYNTITADSVKFRYKKDISIRKPYFNK